ncbi:hypothetical protein KP509_08G028500 [Ceratopteris richardii]|uniref:Peptidase A1 domain-containing protein n=1 Tax=Ceratopteris richardii TaxID=49495 RepID=A0A8T2UF39_CERRI|nr:hypothetical protein KP509_08G028500 [Ceratopteris richardii]
MTLTFDPFVHGVVLVLPLLLAFHGSSEVELDRRWFHVVPLTEHPDSYASQFVDAESAQGKRANVDAFSAGGGRTLSLRLMHRDSPYSPLSTSSDLTPQQRLLGRLDRDMARVQALTQRAEIASEGQARDVQRKVNRTSYENEDRDMTQRGAHGLRGPVYSGFRQGSGEYFVKLGVGTPAREMFMVIDTGSDVMWIQCTPCLDCYEQRDPVFDPTSSSSYRKLSCRSPVCGMLELHGCAGGGDGHCLYQVAYGDGSFTAGEFSVEELTFGMHGGRGRRPRASTTTTVRVAMGCGHDNEGLFTGASGLFGLGGGHLSFPSQVGRRYGGVFSYCLMDRDMEGYSSLEFGAYTARGDSGDDSDRGAAAPRGTIYTPLFRNARMQTFYYVALSGISVGGHLLPIPARAFRMNGGGAGGVIVDSGTSVTRLVEVAYGPLRSAFRAATRDLPFAGGYSLFDTCYDLSRRSTVKLPTMSLHFEGGSEVALPANNYFIPVDATGTFCLAFAGSPGELSIIGNIQQQGFRVTFDTASMRIGFSPNQC